jgi:hypothetical protein
MSDFLTDRHVPLFFDLSDGFPTSIDTGQPMYQCECQNIFRSTTVFCIDCEHLPKRVHMDLDSGMLVLEDTVIT